MKIISIILLALSSCTTLSMEEQSTVAVISSDKKLCILPMWHVTESTTLHELFLKEKNNPENPLHTIEMSSISSHALELYKKTLKEPLETFDTYFNTLNHIQQQTLFFAAEENQLNSPLLTAQLFSTASKDVSDYLSSYIDLGPFIDTIKHTISCTNISDQSLKSSTQTDDKEMTVKNNTTGLCTLVPSSIEDHSPYICITIPPILTDPDNKPYAIEYKQQRNDTSGVSYVITPHIPLSSAFKQEHDDGKKNIWITNNDKNYYIITCIEHPYPIKECTFSYNGKFLATCSNTRAWNGFFDLNHEKESYVLLMRLGTNLKGTDLLYNKLEGYSGNIKAIRFNPQGTLLTVATTNGVYIWNTKGILIQHLIDETYYDARAINWDDDGATLSVLVGTNPEESLSSKIIFYDSLNYNIKNTIPIIHGYSATLSALSWHDIIIVPIDKNEYIGRYQLRPDTSLLPIIPESLQTTFYEQLQDTTHKKILLLLHASTGTPLTFIKANRLYNMDYFMSPNKKFLIATQLTEQEPTAITIYDLASNTQIIIPEELTYITGFGFTSDERSIIVTTAAEIKTHHFFDLYDNNIAQCLEWLKNGPSLMQRYALYRVYIAYKQQERLSLYPQSKILQALNSLPTEPLNIKQFIQNLRTVFIKNQAEVNTSTVPHRAPSTHKASSD